MVEEEIKMSIVDSDSIPRRMTNRGKVYAEIVSQAYAAKPKSACVETASINMAPNKLATALRQFIRRKAVDNCQINASTKEGKVWVTFS